jgi:hypothetical protein
MAVLSDGFKYSLHIPKFIHQIGTDDVIKLLLEIDFVHIQLNELQARMALFGGPQHISREIDSHSVRWLEGREKVSGTASEIEYPHARRDHHSVNFTESAPVIPPGTFPLIKSFCVLVPIGHPLTQERGFRKWKVFFARLFRGSGV